MPWFRMSWNKVFSIFPAISSFPFQAELKYLRTRYDNGLAVEKSRINVERYFSIACRVDYTNLLSF